MDGRKLPVIGLGLYGMAPGDTTYYAIRNALALGYRHFDDAPHKGHTHNDLGAAIYDSGVPRKEIFITSKIAANSMGYDGSLKDIVGILKTLGLRYLDLCLLESPKGGKIVETWDALNEARQLGYCASIGVANFNVTHLNAIVTHGRLLPVVNQIEMHPLVFEQRKELLHWCTTRGILIQAYGSLFAGHEDIMTRYYVVNEIAIKYHKTPAQVLLRWGFQLGFQLIPKTVHEKRMIENMNVFDFELLDAEMKLVSDMKGTWNNYWNPLKEPVGLGNMTRGNELLDYWQAEEDKRKAAEEGSGGLGEMGEEAPAAAASRKG